MSPTNGSAGTQVVTSELLDRRPPADTEAEGCVLGSLLIAPKLCDEVASIIRPEDFYSDANARIYRRLLDLHEEGKRLDALLLRDRLKQAGDFEDVGGDAYLGDVVRMVPTAANATQYARIVRKKAQLRTIDQVSKDVLQSVYSDDADPEQLAEWAERAFSRLAATGRRTETIAMPAAAEQAMARARELRARGQSFGLATGLHEFDQALGGLHQELIVLAARPRMGKTSMALQIAAFAAGQGHGVLFVSLEMSAVELANRSVCALAGVDANRVRTCRHGDRELELMEFATERLAKSRMDILDEPSVTVADVRAAAKAMHRRGPLSLVVVDYLQRITPIDGRIQRYQQLGQISGDLKRFSRELDIPVLVLAQLNREAEQDQQPKLSHLRESGDIESDADMVLLLHRPEVCSKSPDSDERGKAHLTVAKNRNGPTGEFTFQWQAGTTTFAQEDSPTGTEWAQATAGDAWELADGDREWAPYSTKGSEP